MHAGSNNTGNRGIAPRSYTDLPIWEYKLEFINIVQEHQTTILVGEPGCGKTTQIPQFMLESGALPQGKMVACTQPHRVAAMSAARWAAEEMGVALGEEVGYSVRFDHLHSPQTRIKYERTQCFSILVPKGPLFLCPYSCANIRPLYALTPLYC
jgi:HrpA-like RNA helicase